MVLHTRGRVGRRQLFYKPLSTLVLREAFFVRIFQMSEAQQLGARACSPREFAPLIAASFTFCDDD